MPQPSPQRKRAHPRAQARRRRRGQLRPDMCVRSTDAQHARGAEVGHDSGAAPRVCHSQSAGQGRRARGQRRKHDGAQSEVAYACAVRAVGRRRTTHWREGAEGGVCRPDDEEVDAAAAAPLLACKGRAAPSCHSAQRAEHPRVRHCGTVPVAGATQLARTGQRRACALHRWRGKVRVATPRGVAGAGPQRAQQAAQISWTVSPARVCNVSVRGRRGLPLAARRANASRRPHAA